MVTLPRALPRIRTATLEDLPLLPVLEAAAGRLLEAALGHRALPAPGLPTAGEPLFLLVAILSVVLAGGSLWNLGFNL